jgi:hypothetical protein
MKRYNLSVTIYKLEPTQPFNLLRKITKHKTIRVYANSHDEAVAHAKSMGYTVNV